MLFIRVVNPDTNLSLSTVGLIDTGADECALPAAFADMLGYTLPAGESKTVSTGNGLTVAYSHPCNIEILDTARLQAGEAKVTHTMIQTPIDFLPNLHVALIGVRSFMSKFVLTVDYPANRFSLRLPK